MNILKSFFGTPQYVSQTDTTPDGPDPDPEDIWAFTDPDARTRFERKGKLEALEHDIRFEVMRAGSRRRRSWNTNERSSGCCGLAQSLIKEGIGSPAHFQRFTDLSGMVR